MKHDHSMNCQDVFKVLNEYIDGELGHQLCADVEAHIDSCPDCQIVVNTLKKTIQLYHATGQEVTLPKDVKKRLYERLNLGSHAQQE